MVGFGSHDHDACKASLLAVAEAVCAEKKLRLTPTRRRVLELLLDEHKALGAYDILKHLAAEGLGSQPAIVYRALDFLLTHGFAHKVEKLNAFIACTHPQEEHTPAFMICKTCQSIAEIQLPFPQTILGEAGQTNGFKIEKTIVEAEGICPNCIDTGTA
ncbi:Fur family transcriptional regulator [Breoghania sp.]|uniref:Fur family transcriptional regulator n=1 Tax=Breoghania sp. TaxID=2065378 RepID=UPI002AA88285|nr:Fur family transcriptional regulator [Breoghania sp.]